MTKKKFEKKSDKIVAEIKALITYGVPIESVAHYVKISPEKLWEIYGDEIHEARVKARAKIGQFCFYLASGEAMKDGVSARDCAAMSIFWLKSQDYCDQEGKLKDPINTPKIGTIDKPKVIYIERIKDLSD